MNAGSYLSATYVLREQGVNIRCDFTDHTIVASKGFKELDSSRRGQRSEESCTSTFLEEMWFPVGLNAVYIRSLDI